jgi:hypothetical protein
LTSRISPSSPERPALVAPTDTLPNFVNPLSLKTATLAADIVLIAVALLFVVLRLDERICEKKFGLEDVFAGLALFISFVYIGAVFACDGNIVQLYCGALPNTVSKNN